MNLTTNTLGFLYVNIDEHSGSIDSMDEWLESQRISQMISIISETIYKHGGIVSKTFDHAVLGTFPSADSTVNTASEILLSQQGYMETTLTNMPLDIRMSAHYGQLYVVAGNISGNAIKLVAELNNIVKPGAILTSDIFVENLSPSLKKSTSIKGIVKLSGIERQIEVYEFNLNNKVLNDNKIQEVVTQAPKDRLSESEGKTLSIEYSGRNYIVDEKNSRITIGRAKENTVVISAPFASRRHAAIEFANDRFVLTNESFNGTFVLSLDTIEESMCTTHTIIVGSGMISVGCPIKTASDYIVRFSVN